MHHTKEQKPGSKTTEKSGNFKAKGLKTDLWLLWASGGERRHEELFQAEGIVLCVDYGGGHGSIHVLKFLDLYFKGKKVGYNF